MNELQNISNYCWKVIGVEGDLSCSKLSTLIHCRNCYQYSLGGRSLFDRIISKELKQEWTDVLALPKENISAENISVLIFRLKSSWLALSTNFFREAVEIKNIHSVPFRTNRFFKGVVSIHGEIHLCFSVTDILGVTDEVYDESNLKIYKRLVVVTKENENFVFPVDEILGVEKILNSSIHKSPSTISKSQISITKGIFSFENKSVGLVDDEKFLQALKRSLQF